MITSYVTFHELVRHGIIQCLDEGRASNIVNGMPWSFKYQDLVVSHETDDLYLITWTSPTYSTLRLGRDDTLAIPNDCDTAPYIMSPKKPKWLPKGGDNTLAELDPSLQSYCFCNDDISLQLVFGSNESQPPYEKVSLKIGGQFVGYSQDKPNLGEADVWHEGSRSFYRATLLRKLTLDEVQFHPLDEQPTPRPKPTQRPTQGCAKCRRPFFRFGSDAPKDCCHCLGDPTPKPKPTVTTCVHCRKPYFSFSRPEVRPHECCRCGDTKVPSTGCQPTKLLTEDDVRRLVQTELWRHGLIQ